MNNNNNDTCLVHNEQYTTITLYNELEWTTMTMNHANNINIMATITILNVTIHNDNNEQCIKWITKTMHNDYNEQWQWTMITMTMTMNNDNEQWQQCTSSTTM